MFNIGWWYRLLWIITGMIRCIACLLGNFEGCSIDIFQQLLLSLSPRLKLLLDFYRQLGFTGSFHLLKYPLTSAFGNRTWRCRWFERLPRRSLWSLLSWEDYQGSWFHHEQYGKWSLLYTKQRYSPSFCRCLAVCKTHRWHLILCKRYLALGYIIF